MADLRVKIAGVALENPLIAASGTFGFGREYQELLSAFYAWGDFLQGNYPSGASGDPPPASRRHPLEC